jgi:hypothetical protein
MSALAAEGKARLRHADSADDAPARAHRAPPALHRQHARWRPRQLGTVAQALREGVPQQYKRAWARCTRRPITAAAAATASVRAVA